VQVYLHAPGLAGTAGLAATDLRLVVLESALPIIDGHSA